jgi:hypothetical protein
MGNIRLYLYYFRTTLLANWSISLFFSILLSGFSFPSFLYIFSILSITLGFLISFLIKQSSFLNKEEYYFFYNVGITKVKLIIFCTVLNIVFALTIIIGCYYGKQYFTN